MRKLLFMLLIFSILVPSLAWWDNEWEYRKQIILDSSGLSSLVENYPIIVSIRNGNDSIMHYSFDGDITEDSSPNEFDGSVVGSITKVSGVYGSAIYMDGSQYIDSGDVLNFSWEDKFSIFVWVKTNSTDTYNFVISKQLQGSPYTGYALFLTNGKPQVSLVDSYPTMLKKVADETVNDGNWHLIGFTYDGSGSSSGLKIYIDGSEASNYSVDEGTVSSGFESTAHFKIGNRGNYYFKGYVDDLQVFNYTLSAQDVGNLYHGLIHGGKMLHDYSDVVFVWYDSDNGSEYNIPQRSVYDGVFWVRVPAINPASTTSIFVYYGNPNNTVNYNNDESFETYVFQSGKVSVSDFNWVTVNFTYPFDSKPIVIATVEFSGDHPDTEVSRVKDISKYGFVVRAEPYDGYSAPNPYFIYWIAMPNYPRIHISDGFTINATIVRAGGGSTTTSVDVDFSPDSVVLHQLQSYNEVEPGSHSRFDVDGPDATVEECAYQADHVEEDIAVVSVPQGVHYFGDGILYTGKVNTNDKATVSFPVRIENLKSAIAKVGTYDGGEPADVHVESVLEYQMDVNMDETPCTDGTHAYEDLGYFVTNVSSYRGFMYPDDMSYTFGIEETQATVQPTIYSMYISPPEPRSDDDLICTVSVIGSVDYVNFKWIVNGSLVEDYNTTDRSSVLSSIYTVKNDNVTCKASIYYSGTEYDSKDLSITVRNTLPTIPTTLQPEMGTFGGSKNVVDIYCGGSSDTDGDNITYRVYALCCRSWSFIGESTNGTVFWNVNGLPSQENIDMYCKACDDEGCSYSYNPAGTLIIDNDPPETYINIDQYAWYNTSVNVSISCIDNVACNSTYYCVDSVNTCTPSSLYNGTAINVQNEGVNYLRTYSTDEVDNVESLKVYTVKIDYHPPDVTVYAPNETEYESSIPINISVSDNFVVDYCTYSFGGFDGVIPDCKNTTAYGPAGNHTLIISAYDKAGNEKVIQIPIYLRSTIIYAKSGGGGGGGGVSAITLYVKVPFTPKVDAFLCLSDNCTKINEQKGVEKFELDPSEYVKAKVKIVFNGHVTWIDLRDKYGIKSSLLIDAGKEIGLENALYRQKNLIDERFKFPTAELMLSISVLMLVVTAPFVKNKMR